MSTEYIRLLSKKPLNEFTAEEFAAHVRSLYFKPVPAKKPPVIKLKVHVSWRRSAKGTLILSVKREPKWLTQEEYERVAAESGEPLSALFLSLKKKKIKISTLTAEREIAEQIENIPF